MQSPTNRALGLCLALFLSLPIATFAETTAKATDSGRVVIAPLNLGVRATPDLESGNDPVWNELILHFEGREAAALEPVSAANLWREVVRGDASAEGGIYEAYARFARRVAEQVDFSVIVMPSLVKRTVEIRGHQASWDGVQHIVPVPTVASTLGLESHGMVVSTHGGRGEVSAASLHVALLSPDGTIHFEGAGGVALLQRLEASSDRNGRSIRVAEHPDPFADETWVRQGVRAAFEHALPAAPAR